MIDIVAHQMIVMAIFMALGIVLYKSNLVNEDGSKTLSTLLIYIITPVAVFRSFCVEFTKEKFIEFLLSFALCGFVQAFGIIFSHVVYRKKPMEEFAATYPNAGFFGIPVIQACLGQDAVFYMAPLVVFVGTLQHSYGVSLLLGTKTKFNWKRFFLAPNFVGMIAGLIVFVSGLGNRLPKVVNQCVDITANMNTFFAMSILGLFLAQSDLSQLYKNIRIYVISILRLLIIPLICAVIFRFIPVSYAMKMTILLAFAGPVGSNVANYSLLYNKDYSTASLYVSVSTVLCLATLPLFSAIIEHIL